MYPIFMHRKSNDEYISVMIDQPNPVAIPAYLLMGIGKPEIRKEQYKKWLQEQLGQNERITGFLLHVHKLAKEKNGLNIRCTCDGKRRDWHAIAFKEFMEEHREALELMSPYFFNEVPTEAPAEETPQPTMTNPGQKMKPEQLPPALLEKMKAQLANIDPSKIEVIQLNPEQIETIDMNAATAQKIDLSNMQAVAVEDAEIIELKPR